LLNHSRSTLTLRPRRCSLPAVPYSVRNYHNTMTVKWTDGDAGDEPFLMSFLEQFHDVKSTARKKNPAKASFLNRVYDEYDKKYPGRIKAMKFKDIEYGGTDAERRSRMIKVRACKYAVFRVHYNSRLET
jgi:hypothetical protein